ncbi:MAG: hypothetical protein CL424_17820 [Acidimicrobiaceae bacterium]|nr:hypothetical protein [Acidimicrobiaceae bacterium]
MEPIMQRLAVRLQLLAANAKARAEQGADRGEVVEKVIIVAAAAAITIAAMAAIAAAVDIKVAGLEL